MEYILQKTEKKCSKLTQCLGKIFLMQSKLRTHCMLN